MSRNVQTQSKMNRSRKGTYPVDVMLLLPMELQNALEVGVHRLAKIKLRLPDLVLFVLGANEILGDPGWTIAQLIPSPCCPGGPASRSPSGAARWGR